MAESGVSLINLKRHGQWVSDSVKEGHIANSRPLCQEQLCCLLPEVEREKLEKKEEVGQQQLDFIVNNNLICNYDSSMVDLSNLPGMLSGTQTDLIHYMFNQYYNPESDIEVPLLTGRKKQKTSDVTEVTHEKNEIAPKPTVANGKVSRQRINLQQLHFCLQHEQVRVSRKIGRQTPNTQLTRKALT